MRILIFFFVVVKNKNVHQKDTFNKMQYSAHQDAPTKIAHTNGTPS